SYSGSTGPSYWAGLYSDDYCDGSNQSPIDIPAAADMTYDADLTTAFTFTGYSSMAASSINVTNNGHTVQMSISDAQVGNTYMTGGGLDGQYNALQLHFHWGPNDDEGSEHTFRGYQFPLEIDDHDQDNSAIAPLITKLADIPYNGDESVLDLDFSELMPTNSTEFYRYNGSLTTPNCNEAVVWTVFEHKNYISSTQMAVFRTLYENAQGSTNSLMTTNYRPVQSLGSRTVTKSYNTGADTWGLYYTDCALTSQSPINIPSPNSMTYDSSLQLDTLMFNNYEVDFTGEIHNNGHTVQVDIPSSADLHLTGGNLGSTYKAAQLHWHWGADDTTGSEHTYQSKQYPLEVHIVHYKTSYGSLASAVSQSDGLAVVGFFYKIDADDNANYSTLISALSDVQYKSDTTYNVSMNVRDLTNSELPIDGMTGTNLTYFRYQGSLTTPSCSEVVTWTVMLDTIKISSTQLANFREVSHIKSGAIGTYDKIDKNYRPVQALNGRTVYKSANISASGRIMAALPTIIFMLLVCMTFL
ncbi:CAHZ-like protein, partial [Mya arenaria]